MSIRVVFKNHDFQLLFNCFMCCVFFCWSVFFLVFIKMICYNITQLFTAHNLHNTLIFLLQLFYKCTFRIGFHVKSRYRVFSLLSKHEAIDVTFYWFLICFFFLFLSFFLSFQFYFSSVSPNFRLHFLSNTFINVHKWHLCWIFSIWYQL